MGVRAVRTADKIMDRNVQQIKFLANVNSVRVRYMSSAVRLSVVCRLSVCRLSVTFVRPTQAIEIFRNIFTPFGTTAIC